MKKQFLSLLAASLMLGSSSPIITGPVLSKITSMPTNEIVPLVAVPVSLAAIGCYARHELSLLQKEVEEGKMRDQLRQEQEKEQKKKNEEEQKLKEQKAINKNDLLLAGEKNRKIKMLNYNFGHIYSKVTNDNNQWQLVIKSQLELQPRSFVSYDWPSYTINIPAEKLTKKDISDMAKEAIGYDKNLPLIYEPNRDAADTFDHELTKKHLTLYFRIQRYLSLSRAEDMTKKICALHKSYVAELLPLFGKGWVAPEANRFDPASSILSEEKAYSFDIEASRKEFVFRKALTNTMESIASTREREKK